MNHSRLRTFSIPAVLAVVAGLIFALAPAASAADYSPAPPKATVTGSAKAGGTLSISGKASPNAVVVVTLARRVGGPALQMASSTEHVLGSTVAGGDGTYTLAVTVPSALGAGPWTLSVAADGVVVSTMDIQGATATATGGTAGPATAPVAPRAAADGSVAGQLPVTGSTTALIAVTGLTLVVVGGAVTAVARNRQVAAA